MASPKDSLPKDSLRKALGRFGETYACHELQRRGYTIVERNVRFASGEIDIVAREGGELVFIEVKTRKPSRFALPEDAVSRGRMAHLERAIDQYLAGRNITDAAFRIEVAAIDVSPTGHVTRFEVLDDVGLR